MDRHGAGAGPMRQLPTPAPSSGEHRSAGLRPAIRAETTLPLGAGRIHSLVIGVGGGRQGADRHGAGVGPNSTKSRPRPRLAEHRSAMDTPAIRAAPLYRIAAVNPGLTTEWKVSSPNG